LSLQTSIIVPSCVLTKTIRVQFRPKHLIHYKLLTAMANCITPNSQRVGLDCGLTSIDRTTKKIPSGPSTVLAASKHVVIRSSIALNNQGKEPMPEVNPCVMTAIFPNERDSPRSYIITMKSGPNYHFADSVFSWQSF